jgi:hypothetical protein
MQIIDRFVEWLYNKRFPDRKHEHEIVEVNQIVTYSTKNVSAWYEVYDEEKERFLEIHDYEGLDELVRTMLIDNMRKHLVDCIEVTEQKIPYGTTRYVGFLRVYKKET